MNFFYPLVYIVFSISGILRLSAQTPRYYCDSGEVHFISDAPLEIIEASSNTLKGILDPSTRQFAFSIDIMSFVGFNSALQREHFRENYMEISQFTTATFEGKIIEQVDFSQTGTYSIRAKGKMKIHGQTQEIIIPCQLAMDGTALIATSELLIRLADYNIAIPKVVSRKIAEEVKVTVQAEFKTR